MVVVRPLSIDSVYVFAKGDPARAFSERPTCVRRRRDVARRMRSTPNDGCDAYVNTAYRMLLRPGGNWDTGLLYSAPTLYLTILRRVSPSNRHRRLAANG